MECFCSKSRSVHCKIILLDEQELIHEVQDTCSGQAILDVVFRHLNLLETSYFGLRYVDQTNQTHWLDPAVKLNKQFRGIEPYTLYFGVKFYAADPCKLLEEITRYQFFLQGKQDILQGRLPVSFELAAELGAYVVQSELGDYDPRRHSPGYVSEFRFVSNQTVELENRIADLHKTLVGQLPSVAELNYLDKIKWLEMYGVDLHPVLGENNVDYFLGLTPSGIIVLRNKHTVGNYYWPRISKIYYKGRYFMLRVTDKNSDENTFGFETPSKPACKHLYKCCVEHRAFFRLVQNSPSAPDIFSHTPSFRYRNKEEKHIIEETQTKIRPPPTFSRVPSRRYQRRNVEDCVQVAEPFQSQEIKHVSFPQPVQPVESPYRTTCSVSTIGASRRRSDSPRSTRSAPWSQPHSKGLYSSYNNSTPPSPRSVRSTGHRYRSSSIDSQSSTDSRFYKRNRRKRRSRLNSDNDSELSKSSEKSHRKHRRHRSRGHKGDSSSEVESHSHRNKKTDSKLSLSHYELVDSCSQWLEVQRKQAESGVASNIHLASVVSSNRSRCPIGDLDADFDPATGRKHRKRRSHPRNTGDGKNWLPDEFKRHLEFDLVDTSGMTETQLREIPYRVVETNKPKMKYLLKTKNECSQSSPPPPYSQEIPYECRNGNDAIVKSHNHHEHNNHSKYLSSMLESLGISEKYSPRINGHGEHPYVGAYSDSLSMFRVSHEHTDSGLGAEQECTCGGERYQLGIN